MRKITLFSAAILTTLCINTANAATQELTDCSQLQAPKTVLLVHASWCSHCQHYLPIFEAVSNLPQMSEYTFYTKENDSFGPVCGMSIDGVPVTFSHNMQNQIVGSLDKDKLISFVKED